MLSSSPFPFRSAASDASRGFLVNTVKSVGYQSNYDGRLWELWKNIAPNKYFMKNTEFSPI